MCTSIIISVCLLPVDYFLHLPTNILTLQDDDICFIWDWFLPNVNLVQKSSQSNRSTHTFWSQLRSFSLNDNVEEEITKWQNEHVSKHLALPHSISPHILLSTHISTLYHTFCEPSPPFVEATWPWGFTSHITVGGLGRNAAPIKRKRSVMGNIHLVKGPFSFRFSVGARVCECYLWGFSLLCSALLWNRRVEVETFEFSACGSGGTLPGSSGCKDFSRLRLNAHTEPLTCEVELWGDYQVPKWRIAALQRSSGGCHPERCLSFPFMTLEPRLYSASCACFFGGGGVCLCGWVIWSIQFCLCCTLTTHTALWLQTCQNEQMQPSGAWRSI